MSKAVDTNAPTISTNQNGTPGANSVNDLSSHDFIRLLGETKSHISLLSKTKFANRQIRIEKLSTDKADLLAEFYSSSHVWFADEDTVPGKNGTLTLRKGKPILRDLPDREKVQNAYEQLGVKPIPFVRINNANLRYPDYVVHSYYSIDFLTPNAQTFISIMRKLVVDNKLSRITETVYQSLPKHHLYAGVWYQLKSLSNLNSEEKKLLDSYKEETNPRVLSFRDNPSAWLSFLSTLPPNTTCKAYDALINRNYEKVRDLNNKLISVYTFEGCSYHILSLRQVRDPCNASLKDAYDRVIVFNDEAIPRVSSFRDNLRAWESFLDSLPRPMTRSTYDNFLDKEYGRTLNPNYRRISVYNFDGRMYHILRHRQLRDPINATLKEKFDRVNVGGKTSLSVAD